jgi:DNA-directed RNA polymerase specialized sigma24 family protein
MDHKAQRWKESVSATATRTEQVLERYYGQLVEWATLLTRGDVAKARDVVHDFWLHLTLTKPDLGGIANLDGYLYTCLRHIYLSGLASASRDALQFVNIVEFDSVQFALTPNHSNDPVQRQNDLRKVCHYTVWRKAQSKGASYFVLRFFHGYQHHEIADLACLPISAIYNKLRTARAEVRSYLEEPGKLQFTNRDLPPAPKLFWSPLPSIDLFHELRKTILDARAGACLPEDELLGLYRSDSPDPISCLLLSHIVSCERCLEVIDHHFRRPTLRDRESLDDFGGSSNETGSGTASGTPRDKLLRSVRKHRTHIREHRPKILSIAVDGKILASRNVQGESNRLSARIERPDQVSFIEVFSEQGVRLALISIAGQPPSGPHEQRQRTLLNDDRWLELRLSFDGLGLNSEVTYFDPALRTEMMERDPSDAPVKLLGDASSDQTAKVLSQGASSLLEYVPGFLRLSRRPSASFFGTLFTKMNRILASVAAAAVIASVMLFLVWERRPPTVSASELLQRAEIWDSRPSPATQSGVVFQRVRIHTKKTTTERTLYRDVAGRRKPKLVVPREVDVEVNHLLENAGIDLQQPLSAANFRGWHDHLSEWTDEIRSADANVLMLVTDTSSSIVKESTLSVRKTDFHPVARRVVMRDSEEIEISELNYDVLSWDAINASSLFEEPAAPPAGVQQPTANSMEIEMAVRYALHGIGADLGEPIEIQTDTPGPASVSVVGIVASPGRKQELLAVLGGMPHVTARLQTEQEAAQALPEQPSQVREAKPLVVAAHSPIEKELLNYCGDPLAVESFSQHAVVVTKDLMAHAWALRHLSERYATAESPGGLALSPSSRRMLQAMRRDHFRAMSAATSELATLLRPVLQSIVEDPPESSTRQPLFENAQKVQRLTLELLSGSGPVDTNETEPAGAARDLLAALRGLEITLEELP